MLVKLQIDKILMSMLGRKELVERWWYTSNKKFEDKTPYEVYQSGEEGRKKVNDYIVGKTDYTI